MSTEITIDEVRTLVNSFFHGVAADQPAEKMERFFLYPECRVVAPNGQSFSMENHRALHKQWTDEKHEIGGLEVNSLSDDPARARVTATVYWQATKRESASGEKGMIKAVVGEDWIMERRPDSSLCFVLYHTTFFHPLPDSASIEL